MSLDRSLAANGCFSSSYAEARKRFLEAARKHTTQVRHFPIAATGATGEELATDIAVIAPKNPRALLILSSATHGVEGFCGSACQLAFLEDTELLEKAAREGISVLLIHAINPYGFSWCSRTNEDNIDLNRNALSFKEPLPSSPGYDQLHQLLIPKEWPPTDANRQAIAEYIEQHGLINYRDAVSKGQYSQPKGIFFGGNNQSKSIRTLNQVLQTDAAGFTDVGWIDFHTGLGPYGHGEKIFAGRPISEEVARAKKWWGQDIAIPFAGTSASAELSGVVASTLYDHCPDARRTLMALEFGTVPFIEMVDALRGEAWLRKNPECQKELASSIRQNLRDAFYREEDLWKGMVLGQSRVAVLQAINGLASSLE
jgi:hypothetical protein